SEAENVKVPYLIIGAAVLLVSILFMLTHIPDFKEEKGEKKSLGAVLRNKHLVNAVIAQFFYVGAQVGVGSFFIRFSRYVMNIP
ncbi:glucose/galactose MFS transporter, partial [Klebsiella pneumoniae]